MSADPSEHFELPENTQNDDTFEPVNENMHDQIGVSVQGLRKTFSIPHGGKFVAVNNIFIDMYEGQILSLLGHNGAGKTTTINMLCGFLPPTSGHATVGGLSLRTDLASIRRILGVCPQHDILFPTLTVTEHLYFFGRIKGIPEADLKAEIDLIIREVGLTEKVKSLSAALSGGQKRKLSVGIALMGGSKIVFLDEPTSGMDPFARRATWDLIQKKKKGRVIILTTHFMDEADHLGDRIAIMADGVIRCCGSSLFLKSKYGVGYSMTVVKKGQETPDEPILDLVKQHVASMSLLSSSAGELCFRLPFDAAGKFQGLFDDIDGDSGSSGIQSYSISVTTLEEVFLRVAQCSATDEEKQMLRRQSQSNMEQIESVTSFGGVELIEGEKDKENSTEIKVKRMGSKTGSLTKHIDAEPASFCRHFHALIAKRFHSSKRDKKVWWCQVGIPLIILLLGTWLVNFGATMNFPSILLSGTELYNVPLRVPFGGVNTSRLSNFLTQPATLSHLDSNITTNSTDFARYILDNRQLFKETFYGAFFLGNPMSPMSPDFILVNTTARDSL
eukprot:252000_1